MSLTTRPATPADTDFCRDAHHRAYHDVVVKQFGVWDEALQDKFFADGWEYAQRKSKILIWDGTPCGFTSSDRKKDHFKIIELVILPEFQRRGIGSSILDKALQKANSKKFPLRLTVLLQNKAKELYERKGFRITGKTETHFLMEFLAPSAL
jgi:ribosomal protein S18 acetylase RimI-like enzyme